MSDKGITAKAAHGPASTEELRGDDLFVIQNQLNQIAVVDLDRRFGRGEGKQLITDDPFDVPTTIDRFGSTLYAVNARFGTPPTPTTPYTVVRVGR